MRKCFTKLSKRFSLLKENDYKVKMIKGNYCRNCGQRIFPSQPYCINCGCRTGYLNEDDHVLTVPIHDVGFFNLDIDFSPYIESDRDDFEFEICSCGYLNHAEDEYCSMCGAKRFPSKFAKIFKNQTRQPFSIDNVECECGYINSRENNFCEECGRALKDIEKPKNHRYNNFRFEFENPIFCFCGEENDEYSQFCTNCGRPLMNYGPSNDISILCVCSKINESTSDFCIECGKSLNKESSVIVCVCGNLNPEGTRFCEKCDRPLNPQKTLKTRIICSCGELLDWDSEFCNNCGKNIKKAFALKKSINGTVNSVKKMFR